MRSAAFIMEHHDGKPIHVVGDEVVVKISSRDTDGAFAVFESRTLPLHGPPLHMHHDQDETWRVINGEFVFEVDGQEIYAGPGATVFAPRGSRHTFQNIGTTPGRLVTTVVPGGLDLFFEELEQAVPRGADIDPAKVVPIFERYKLELLGPPLARRNVATAAGAD
jgi:mannose-6-phosphate isomerase-like protein (cupin superfamily)